MTLNGVGKRIPDGLLSRWPIFEGVFDRKPNIKKWAPLMRSSLPGSSKVCISMDDVLRAIKLSNGMTLSFHHHLRNGDHVLNLVLEACSRLGVKDLTIAPSGIFSIHRPIIKYIQEGTISKIETNYAQGPVAEALSKGVLREPVVFRTHGGRVRAIEAGELRIDVAFIAAPTADPGGNITGLLGPSACGSLGYAFSDAQYADQVVAITDNLVDFPICPISIPGTLVDYVVPIEKIGDPSKIVSGATRITRDPLSLTIAKKAAELIGFSSSFKTGLSFQTGSGGISLATAAFMREKMREREITGSFIMGGITSYLVEFLREGLFKTILDTQCFDLDSIASLRDNVNHIEVDAGYYANPWNKGAVVNHLDVVVLSATEIDTDFNVNVVTSSNGMIIGGSGGHSDASAGAKLTIIVSKSTQGRNPVIRDKVTTVTTPGETVDLLVTEWGISVNPRRGDLSSSLKDTGLPMIDIFDLKKKVENLTGRPEKLCPGDKLVGVVEYRDGSIIDVIHQIQ